MEHRSFLIEMGGTSRLHILDKPECMEMNHRLTHREFCRIWLKHCRRLLVVKKSKQGRRGDLGVGAVRLDRHAEGGFVSLVACCEQSCDPGTSGTM